FQNPQTLEGQETEEVHDYALVDLDYDIAKPSHRHFYKDLLIKVTEKILASEEFKVRDIQLLLQSRLKYDGFGKDRIEREVAKMVDRLNGLNWASLDEDRRSAYTKRLKTAAVYRILQAAHRRKEEGKQFGGFRDLT